MPMERYVTYTLLVLAVLLVCVFSSDVLFSEHKLKEEDVCYYDKCVAEERGGVLIVGNEWIPSKTNLEVALINREIATTFARENFKVYYVVYRATTEEKTDALNNGVTLITKDEQKRFRRGITYHESLMYTEFYFPAITKLERVKFIIGHVLPINGTIDEATYIRDAYFTDASLLPIFFYIPENEDLPPSELAKQQKQMEDCAKSADLVLLLGSKIFDYFKSKLRRYSGINLHIYLPYPKTDIDLDPMKDSEIPSFFEILTFHADMEIKEEKFHNFEMSAEILGDVYRGLKKMEIRWILLGVSDEIKDSFRGFLYNRTNNNKVAIIPYPPSPLDDILRYLQQCHLVLYTGENAYGMPALLAASVGTPFITSEETGFAAFLQQDCVAISTNYIVQNDKKHFVEKIRDLLKSYSITQDFARKTKAVLERSAINGTIAQTRKEFLAWLRKFDEEKENKGYDTF